MQHKEDDLDKQSGSSSLIFSDVKVKHAFPHLLLVSFLRSSCLNLPHSPDLISLSFQ